MYWQTINNTDGNQADFINEIFQGFLNMVNKTVLFPPQIKTTQRYIWTKREFTEEGKPLGELVDQVSLFYSVYNKVHLIDCTSQGMLIFCFYFFFLTLGSHSCEDQQRRGGGCDEGAEAAKRAAGVRFPPGCGCGWCQRTLGKVHYQEGGQECRKETDNHHFMPYTCLHGCLLTVFLFHALL